MIGEILFSMKRAHLLFVIILGLLGIGFLALFFFPLPTRSLDKLVWKASSYLIAIPHADREGKEGTLFLRVKDGKEQFMSGQWSVFYASNDSVYLYGSFSIDEAVSSTGLHLYNIYGGDKIYDIPLEHVSGSIVSTQENGIGTYVLLGSTSGTRTQYCLMTHLESKVPLCPTIGLPDVKNALWNPEKEHELVLQTASGTLFTVDPWEKEEGSPRAVTSDTDPKRLEQLSALFQVPAVDPRVSPGSDKKTLHTFLNLALVTDAHGWTLHWLPPGADVAWYFDADHFLVKESNRISLYDLKSRMFSTLLEEKGVGKKSLLFHNETDHEL